MESLRSRAINEPFSELATNPTAAKYKSVCEAGGGCAWRQRDTTSTRAVRARLTSS
jgi:hypothetical protein